MQIKQHNMGFTQEDTNQCKFPYMGEKIWKCFIHGFSRVRPKGNLWHSVKSCKMLLHWQLMPQSHTSALIAFVFDPLTVIPHCRCISCCREDSLDVYKCLIQSLPFCLQQWACCLWTTKHQVGMESQSAGHSRQCIWELKYLCRAWKLQGIFWRHRVCSHWRCWRGNSRFPFPCVPCSLSPATRQVIGMQYPSREGRVIFCLPELEMGQWLGWGWIRAEGTRDSVPSSEDPRQETIFQYFLEGWNSASQCTANIQR